jgi:hypothetical protein
MENKGIIMRLNSVSAAMLRDPVMILPRLEERFFSESVIRLSCCMIEKPRLESIHF